jgi:hypothetical protein
MLDADARVHACIIYLVLEQGACPSAEVIIREMGCLARGVARHVACFPVPSAAMLGQRKFLSEPPIVKHAIACVGRMDVI